MSTSAGVHVHAVGNSMSTAMGQSADSPAVSVRARGAGGCPVPAVYPGRVNAAVCGRSGESSPAVATRVDRRRGLPQVG